MVTDAAAHGFDPARVPVQLLHERRRKPRFGQDGRPAAPTALHQIVREVWHRTKGPSVATGLARVGPLLVHEHADRQLLHLLRRTFPEQDFEEREVLSEPVHVLAFLRATGTLLAWARILRRQGSRTVRADVGLLVRDAVVYAGVRRAIAARPVSAVVVAGDLVPKRYAVAAAANAAQVPVDVVLNDQDHGRGFHRPRFRGLVLRTAFLFEPHDACRVASPPARCAVVPTPGAAWDPDARTAAVLVAATVDVPAALRAAEWLLATGDVDDVVLRPHPRDQRAAWAEALPPGVHLERGGAITDLAGRVLLAVCDPATTATVAALRAGIRCFGSGHFADRRSLVELPRIDVGDGTLADRAREYPTPQLRQGRCDADVHVRRIPFEDALAEALGESPGAETVRLGAFSVPS